AQVLALELHPHRVETLKKLCNAPNVEIAQGDATRFEGAGGFDLVLADVPCSGTGTLARNPEIKWRLQPRKLAELHHLQLSIARNALAQAQPGGILVYSTCSLEAEENEAVVEELLREGGCEIVAAESVLAMLSGPYLRTVPGEQSCDGFFAAVLRKT
ncbi:MAG: antitermination protein NusB, partial [Acidobacteriaceae bacterium]